MTDFGAHWNTFLSDDSKSQVDIIVSIHEEGINHFLNRSFEIDQTLPAENKKFHRVFERTFDTFGDERKFKVTLALNEAIKVKLPPFTSANHLSKAFEEEDPSSWNAFEYPTDGPELIATNDENENMIEIAAPAVSIEMEWPNLDPSKPPHSWKIPPFQVVGQAELQLSQEDADFYTTIVPKFIKIDIPRNTSLLQELRKEVGQIPEDAKRFVDNCEDKFVDLFIIAANIAAYEQTPKLVTSIKLPVPVIKDRPVQPAAFNISRDIMTVGFGIDKVSLENFNENLISAKSNELDFAIKRDLDKAGGLINVAYKNAEGKTIKSPTQLIARGEAEQDVYFSNTNQFIQEQQAYLMDIKKGLPELKTTEDEAILNTEAFAIGINEYFFDTIVNSAIPTPKHKCEKEERIGPVKGYVCHWTAFRNPDIGISQNAELSGAVDINIGGSIHGCVKKFWDCSWRWACAKLALAVVGRPRISIKILKANGIRTLAQFDAGGLRLATNLPTPFRQVVEFFSSMIIKFLVAFANVLAGVLSFYVLKPEFEVESLSLRLQLRKFSSFYFERTESPSQDPTKNKFIGYKTNLAVTKL